MFAVLTASYLADRAYPLQYAALHPTFFTGVISSVVTFVAWAAWHMAYNVLDGTAFILTTGGLIGFLMGLLGSSFILGCIYNITNSLWLCVFYHALLNAFSQTFSGSRTHFVLWREMTKPYSMLLLGKRVTAFLRRGGKAIVPERWQFGDITVDFSGYTASGADEKIDLTPKEFDILRLLVEHKGLVLSRQQILDHVWDLDADVMERVIDSYIKNLRKKLRTEQIVTVKGIGYKFEVRS